jgi:hypothetical protein
MLTVQRTKLIEKTAAAILLSCFVIISMINVFPFLGEQVGLRDFGSFYASGLKLRNGENPYSPDSEYVWEFYFPRVGAGGQMVNLNPPITALLFGYISRFNAQQAFSAWQLGSAILYTMLIFVLAAFYKQNTTPSVFLWAFTLAGFWQTLTLGQIYVLLLLFIILGWIFLQRKWYILSGLAIGVVLAVKPNFLLWPIFLLVTGYFTTFLTSIASGLLISSIPLFFYGIEIYQQWWQASAPQIATLILPGNSSILGLTARFHDVTAGLVISLMMICVLFYLTRSKSMAGNVSSEQVSGLGILASILASPISWVGYTIFLLPIFFCLKKWSLPILLSAAILSFPFGVILKLWQTSLLNFIIFGWFYGWGTLLFLGALVKNTMMTTSIQTN